jgi:cell division septal protein FtsQ
VKTTNAGGGRNHQVFGVRAPRGNKTIKNTVPLKHVKLWLWLWLLWFVFVVVVGVADSASAASAVSIILPNVWYANVPTFAKPN